MKAINRTTIAHYLDEFKWHYENLAEQDVIMTGYRCPLPFYDYGFLLEIRPTEHWITLRGFLQRHVPEARRAAMLALLSSLNAQAYEVRFFMVEDTVVVQTEVTQPQCNSQTFLAALINICYYATKFGLEIAVLSANPSVAALYTETRAGSKTAGDLVEHDENAMLNFEISANRLAY